MRNHEIEPIVMGTSAIKLAPIQYEERGFDYEDRASSSFADVVTTYPRSTSRQYRRVHVLDRYPTLKMFDEEAAEIVRGARQGSIAGCVRETPSRRNRRFTSVAIALTTFAFVIEAVLTAL